jgi:hypothetical protein
MRTAPTMDGIEWYVIACTFPPGPSAPVARNPYST